MKFLFYFVFLYFVLIAQVQCTDNINREINDIELNGIINLNKNEIYEFISNNVGDSYDEDNIISCYKKLFNKYKLQDLSIVFDKGLLRIDLKEGFIVDSIKIEDPDQNIVEYILLKKGAIKTEVSHILDRDILREDIERIYQYYYIGARYGTQVYYTIEQYNDYPNSVELVFHIKKSKPLFIRKINFEGNKEIDDESIRSSMIMRGFRKYDDYYWGKNSRYLRDKVYVDIQNITYLYQSKGYLDFSILDVRVTDYDDKFVDIDFYISEGNKYILSDIVLNDTGGILSEGIELEISDTIHNYSKKNLGKAVSNNALMSLKYEIEKILSQKAEDIFTINYNYEKGDEFDIKVFFQIEKNKSDNVNRIDIIGNNRTTERYIRREMEIAEGDVFNANRILKDRQKILSLSFFNNVEVDEIKINKNGHTMKDISFVMEERKTGSANLALSYETTTGLGFNVGVSENNFLGEAMSVNASLRYSFAKEYDLVLGLYKPRIYDTNISSGINIFNNQIKSGEGKNINADNYDVSYFSNNLGFRPYIAFKINDYFSHHLNYEFKRNVLTLGKDKVISEIIKNDAGNTYLSSIGNIITFDTRKFFLGNKVQGFKSDLSVKIAGFGGTENFFKTSLSGSYTHFIFSDFIESVLFSTYANLTTVYAYGDDYVNTASRTKLGSDQIRGFAISGIGPRDKKTQDALGGQVAFYSNTQVDFPMYFFRNILKGSLFVDLANSYHVAVEPDLQYLVEENKKLRMSVGGGLLFKIPGMTTIRLDYGIPIMKHPNDKISNFRLSITENF